MRIGMLQNLATLQVDPCLNFANYHKGSRKKTFLFSIYLIAIVILCVLLSLHNEKLKAKRNCTQVALWMSDMPKVAASKCQVRYQN